MSHYCKKNSKHTGGGEAEILSQIYKKSEFSEEDKEKIKAAMFIKVESSEPEISITYEPYTLAEKINMIYSSENYEHKWWFIDDIILGENDPIRHFFQKGVIFQGSSMNLIEIKLYGQREIGIFYEFTGNNENFTLHVSNCKVVRDLEKEIINENFFKYVDFLKKLYPESLIDLCFYREKLHVSNNKRIFYNRNSLVHI